MLQGLDARAARTARTARTLEPWDFEGFELNGGGLRLH